MFKQYSRPKLMLNLNKLQRYISENNFILSSNSFETNTVKNAVYTRIKINSRQIDVAVPEDDVVFKKVNLLNYDIKENELVKGLLKILNAERESLIASEIISSGISQHSANVLLNDTLKLVNESLDENKYSETSHETVQIFMGHHNLWDIVNLIVDNAHNCIVLSVSSQSQSILSLHLLINSLLENDRRLANRLILVTNNKNTLFCDSIVMYQGDLVARETVQIRPENRMKIMHDLNTTSTLLLTEDADVYSAAMSFLDCVPDVALLPENAFDTFVSAVKDSCDMEPSLADSNRRWNLCLSEGCSPNVTKGPGKLVCGGSVCLDDDRFTVPAVLVDVQPADRVSGKPHSCMLMTYRTMDEAVSLANKLARHKTHLSLWCERVSLCLSLWIALSRYRSICVNRAAVPRLCSLPVSLIAAEHSSHQHTADKDGPKVNLAHHLKALPPAASPTKPVALLRRSVLQQRLQVMIDAGLVTSQIVEEISGRLAEVVASCSVLRMTDDPSLYMKQYFPLAGLVVVATDESTLTTELALAVLVSSVIGNSTLLLGPGSLGDPGTSLAGLRLATGRLHNISSLSEAGPVACVLLSSRACCDISAADLGRLRAPLHVLGADPRPVWPLVLRPTSIRLDLTASLSTR